MTAQPKQKMTVDEFVVWAMKQPGRYELVRGEVYAQASERARHNLAKLAIARVLQDSLKKAGLPCTVFTDGMTVRIDENTAREPDAAVQCGVTFDPDMIVLEAPLIVVEVISPSSEKDDSSTKLTEYFTVPSIRHYLIIDAGKRLIIHHARGASRDIVTRIHTDGDITLDPPGLSFAVTDAMIAL